MNTESRQHEGTQELAAAGDEGPIRLDSLLARCMNDSSFALALLSELETSVPPLVGELSELVEQGETAAASELMHSLKGATGILGADGLSELAHRGEVAGRDGDLCQLKELMPRIQGTLAACLEHLPELRCRLS